MKMIESYEITVLIETQRDADGEPTAFDYAVVEYIIDTDGKETENVLMSGSADDFDSAERNVRVKLANLDRPTL